MRFLILILICWWFFPVQIWAGCCKVGTTYTYKASATACSGTYYSSNKAWTSGSWGSCSSACKQSRTVTCSTCCYAIKPATSQSCDGYSACSSTSYSYSTAANARGTGTCKYNTSSAKFCVNGASTTCYKRGSVNNSSTSCSATDYPYTSNATAMNSSGTCHFNYSSASQCIDGAAKVCYKRGSVNNSISACAGGYTTAASAKGSGTCLYNYQSDGLFCVDGVATNCYSRTGGYSNSVAGTCGSNYTTASGAAGSGACQYAYTSYIAAGSCGGASRVCYRRTGGYSNATNGTCSVSEGMYTSAATAISDAPSKINKGISLAQTGCRNKYGSICYASSAYTAGLTTGKSSNATCGGTEVTCYYFCYDYKVVAPDNSLYNHTSGNSYYAGTGSCAASACTPVVGSWTAGSWSSCSSCSQSRSYSCTGSSCNGGCSGSKPANDTRTCGVVNATACPSGYTYTTLAAAKTDSNGCTYPTASASTSGACGGSSKTCYRRTSSTATNLTNAVCGAAATTYTATSTTYGSAAFCAAGSASPTSPAFPAAGGSVSWTCAGSCGGTSLTCTARRQLAGACGSNAKAYGLSVTAYPSTTFCDKGTVAATPAFPDGGKTVSWTCSGTNGGAAANCSACRNQYAWLDVSTFDCAATYGSTYTASNCANTAACTTQTRLYSVNCQNGSVTCYKPQTCVEVNGSGYTTSKPSGPSITGSNDGNNKTCYKACSYASQPTCAATALAQGKLGTYTASACAGANVSQVDRITANYSTVSNNTCQNSTLACYRCATNATCGTAAKSWAETDSSYGTATFCASGSNPSATPNFPSVGGSVTWTCTGLNAGENSTCTATRKMAGACGTANNQKFVYAETSYGTYTACSKGSASGFSFPAAGGTDTWTCTGTNGGATASCTACHNLYPIRSFTKCPSGYSETACANLVAAACPSVKVNYSLSCRNYAYTCYRGLDCNQANPLTTDEQYNAIGYWVTDGQATTANLAVYGSGQPFTYNGATYPLVNGVSDSDNQICYARCQYPVNPGCAATETTTPCANLAACQIHSTWYSAVVNNYCQDTFLSCYRPQTCAQANQNDASYTQNNTDPHYAYALGLPDGNNQACYRRLTCQELGYSLLGTCRADQLSQPAPTGYLDGVTDAACVVCNNYSPAWFQVAGGNLYAQGNIINHLGENFPNAFLSRQAGTCSNSAVVAPDNTSGLPLVGGTTIVMTNGGWTNREVPDTGATQTHGASTTRLENYAHWQTRLDFSQVPACPDSLITAGAQINESYVCQIAGDYTLTTDLLFPAATKQVIFVAGDLTIDNINLTVPTSSFVGFLVAGDIIFSANLGTNAAAATACTQTPQIQGVFLADGKIRFPAGDLNSTNFSCDKRLTVAGTYVGFGGVEFSRTFAGCLGASSYPNFNAQFPTLTFVYRPDFLINIPTWMQSTLRLRQEVN